MFAVPITAGIRVATVYQETGMTCWGTGFIICIGIFSTFRFITWANTLVQSIVFGTFQLQIIHWSTKTWAVYPTDVRKMVKLICHLAEM